MGELAASFRRRDLRLSEDFDGVSALVVEDEAMVRAAIKMALTSWGCRVLDCASVEEAEQALHAQNFAPNIVLADLHLGRHGEPTAADLLPGVLSRTGLSGIPVILVSGDSAPSCQTGAQNRGWGFLLKPFKPDTLHETITCALEQLAAPTDSCEPNRDDSPSIVGVDRFGGSPDWTPHRNWGLAGPVEPARRRAGGASHE